MKRIVRRPSSAMTVALVALFVALSGSAFAVGNVVVPLAKRALTADKAKVADLAKEATVADNAKKLGGQDAAALVGQAVSQASRAPGPASTAAGLITVKTAPFSLNADGQGEFAATCDSGQKVVGGGYDNPVGTAYSVDTWPTPDGASWKIYLIATPSGAASGNVYAVCLK